jgi:hypothetical protein
LKGAVSNFAAPPAIEAAQRLQKMGDAGRLEGAGAALGQLEREIDALLASLSVVVRRLSGGPRSPGKAVAGSAGRKRAAPLPAARRRRR